MATTFTIVPLTGSTDFRGIPIVQTASPGTTVHTAQASTTLPDFLTIDLENTDTVARPFTVEWGGTTNPDDRVMTGVVFPGECIRICRKRPIRNSLVVKISSITMTWIDGLSYTGAASKLIASGHCQRQA